MSMVVRGKNTGGFKRKRAYTAQRKVVAVKKAGISRILGLHPEMKYFNGVQASTVIATGGAVYCINQIAEGLDYFNRLGRRVTGRYVNADIQVAAPTGSGNTDSVLMALVWDKGANGTTPAFGTIFDISAASPGQAFLNSANYGRRFVVLWLERCYVQANNNTIEGNFTDCIVSRRYRAIPFKFGQTEYGGSGGSTPTQGALYLCFGSMSNTGVAATAAAVAINWRVGYHDA